LKKDLLSAPGKLDAALPLKETVDVLLLKAPSLFREGAGVRFRLTE